MPYPIYATLFDELDTAVAFFHPESSGEFSLIAINRTGAAIEKQERGTLLGAKLSALFPNAGECGLAEVLSSVREYGGVKKCRMVLQDYFWNPSVREMKLIGLETGEIAMVYRLETDRCPDTLTLETIHPFWKKRTTAIADVMGRIAHQWRQPLSTLTMIMQELRDSYLHDELDEAHLNRQADLFMREITYLSKTIDGFRGFFKTDSHKRRIDIKELIEDVVRYFLTDTKQKRISVEVEGVGFETETYPGELRHVLLILLENARDAIEKKTENLPKYEGYIFIKTDWTETGPSIRIHDNGVGISAEAMDRLFDPYYTTKFEARGVGLSLYIAKVMTEERLGGSLHALNGENGTVFTLELGAGE